MFFWLKKALTLPFLPLYFVLGVGAVGVLLLWSRKRERLGRVLLTLAFAVLAISANKGVAAALLAPLEHRFSPVPEAASPAELPADLRECTAILVLGGGHADSSTLSRVNQLVPGALSRVAEALRISRLLPHAKVIFSGHHPTALSHARVMAEAAISLGLDPDRVVLFENTRDTEDEARELALLMGSKPAALVTSAWHMPRAVELCQRVGAVVVPCPADYALKPGAQTHSDFYTWDMGALDRTSRAIREYLGIIWTRIGGN